MRGLLPPFTDGISTTAQPRRVSALQGAAARHTRAIFSNTQNKGTSKRHTKEILQQGQGQHHLVALEPRQATVPHFCVEMAQPAITVMCNYILSDHPGCVLPGEREERFLFIYLLKVLFMLGQLFFCRKCPVLVFQFASLCLGTPQPLCFPGCYRLGR